MLLRLVTAKADHGEYNIVCSTPGEKEFLLAHHCNRASLEKHNVGAGPPRLKGMPLAAWEIKRQEHRAAPAEGAALACAPEQRCGNTCSCVKHRAYVNRNPVRGITDCQGCGQPNSQSASKLIEFHDLQAEPVVTSYVKP